MSVIGWVFDQGTHPAQNIHAILADILVEDTDHAFGWFNQAEKHANRSCFAGTVGTEEAVDISLFNMQIKFTDRCTVPVCFP
ncbi:hypothetical protein D3C76_1535360 [compost metagenome]